MPVKKHQTFCFPLYPVRSAKAYINQFLELQNAMYSYRVYCTECLYERNGIQGNVLKGIKLGKMRRQQKHEKLSSQSLVNYETSVYFINTENLLSESVYVSFRKSRPGKVTQKKVLKVMQDNNIDVSQLVELSADHCQQA